MQSHERENPLCETYMPTAELGQFVPRNEWLSEFLTPRRDTIVKYWIESIRAKQIPSYSKIPDEYLLREFPPTVDTMIEAFRTGDPEVPRRHALEIIRRRVRQGFMQTELQNSLHSLEEAVMRVVCEAEPPPEKQIDARQSLAEMYHSVAFIAGQVYEQLRLEQRTYFMTAYDLGLMLSRTLDLKEVLGIGVRGAAEPTDGAAGIVLLRDDGEEQDAASFQLPPELRQSIVQICATLGCVPAGSSPYEPLEYTSVIREIDTDESLRPWAGTLLAAGYGIAVGVPLFAAGRILGGLVVFLRPTEESTNLKVDFLLALVAHISSAVQNARLYAMEARGRQELSLLLKAARTFTSTLNLDLLLTYIPEATTQMLNADMALILIPDESGERLHIASKYAREAAASEALERVVRFIEPGGLPVDCGAAGRAFASGEAVLIGDYTQYPVRVPELVGTATSLLIVPMRLEDKSIGLLAGASLKKNAFISDDIPLAQGLADQAATGIENARLYEEAKGKRELSLLLEAGRLFTSTLDAEVVFREVSRLAIRFIGGEVCAVTVPDISGNTLHIKAMFSNIPGLDERLMAIVEPQGWAVASQALVSRAFTTGEALLENDFPSYPGRLPGLEVLVGSMLAVPIILKEKRLGVFLLVSRAKNAFNQSDLPLAKGVADQAAIAMENAELYCRERNIAVTLQRSLLPDSLPDITDYEVAVAYQAALKEAELGGDYYDLYGTRGGGYNLTVADVSGKGLKAAVFTAMGKYMMRAFAAEDPRPLSMVKRFNRAFDKYEETAIFITAFTGLLDPVKHTLTYVNAGQNLPMLCPRRPDRRTLLGVTGPALGILPELEYEEKQLHFEPGDTLLLYSDGAIDARRDNEFLGIEGLHQIFMGLAGAPVQEIVGSIRHEVLDYSGGRIMDDIVIMALRRTR